MRKDVETYVERIPREERCLLNKSELARRLGCDRRTVTRQLKIANGDITPQSNKREYKTKLEGFESVIKEKIDKHGCSAMAVYKFIQKKGFDGKYTIVADFVRNHKDKEIKKATIRYETAPGLQAQVDWKENLIMVSRHGEIFSVNIFLMVLGYSRVKFLSLTIDRNQDTLFRCMIEGFKHFRGVPNEILFDNMRTVVDRAKSTYNQVQFNDRFTHFSNDAGFKPLACMPYRPQTKGKVESLARLVNRLKAYNEEFETYEQLEEIVNAFNHEINNEVSQATGEIPSERYKKEKEYLNPLPDMDMLLSYISRKKEYKVTKESMFKYKGKKYSVPTKYIGDKVHIDEKSDGNLYVYYNDDLIVCHPTSNKSLNYKPVHICEILKSDAMKKSSDDEIYDYIMNNMSHYDLYLEGE